MKAFIFPTIIALAFAAGVTFAQADDAKPTDNKTTTTGPATSGFAGLAPMRALGLDITFKARSAELTDEAKDQLRRLADAINSLPPSNYDVLIEGHADSAGRPDGNMALSKRRAQAVKDYLVKVYNVPPSRLDAVGKGQTAPIDASDPANPANRRVQVVIFSPPPTAPSDADVEAKIQQAMAGFQCAEIKPIVTAASDLQLTGFVASAGDLERLRRALAGTGDIGPAALDGVAVRPWPQCEVIKVLDETVTPSHADMAPQLEFNAPNLVYQEGDVLIMRASARADGYLYVDWLDSDGNVVHLLPTPEHRDNQLRAGQGLSLGRPKEGRQAGERVYEIGAPFGADLVVAISSPKPLLRPRAEEEESAKTYLPVLTKALKAAAAGPNRARTMATYTVINTVPANGGK